MWGARQDPAPYAPAGTPERGTRAAGPGRRLPPVPAAAYPRPSLRPPQPSLPLQVSQKGPQPQTGPVSRSNTKEQRPRGAPAAAAPPRRARKKAPAAPLPLPLPGTHRLFPVSKGRGGDGSEGLHGPDLAAPTESPPPPHRGEGNCVTDRSARSQPPPRAAAAAPLLLAPPLHACRLLAAAV